MTVLSVTNCMTSHLTVHIENICDMLFNSCTMLSMHLLKIATLCNTEYRKCFIFHHFHPCCQDWANSNSQIIKLLFSLFEVSP